MSVTFGAAKTMVCKPFGTHNDADELALAGDALVAAIRTFSLAHAWSFKRYTITPDLTITAGTDLYTLIPAPGMSIKKIYTARFLNATRPLRYVRRRQGDRMLSDIAAARGEVGYDFIKNVDGSGKIELIPPPSQGGTLRVRVYQNIDDVYADGDNLDVPDEYFPALLTRGKYFYAMERDSDGNRVALFLDQSTRLLNDAITFDNDQPDEDVAILSQEEGGLYWNDGFE